MKIFYLLTAVVLLTACNKKEDLTASPAAPLYKIPQGTAAYDDTIFSIYKKYDTYILYKFSQVDYAYNYTDKLSDSAFAANPAYIPAVLDLFKKEVLNRYPDSILRKTLPIKVLLASYIGTGGNRNVKGFSNTRSMLCIGWADSTLVSKSPAELRKIRGSLHRNYFDRAFKAVTLTIPPSFVALCPPDYNAMIATTQYSFGIIEPILPGQISNMMVDFLGYVEYIASHSEAEATAEIFTPKVDSRGLIKKKYAAVVDYFNSMGIDLQAIGAAQ
ncbi:hypothetical protein [Chitinophaga sp. Cy-1792]|uniref:hypothetical protein n=1 Tax=Chitinophaga sp. Cy-1792 TaxID=2608339 RepID=UPI0014234342|nr:hypothetical protein [Chitinophaga sp. Cy-1792]NIG54342.1 hypothetical protein [Chitinophaga sp. Cy-1792]